MSMRRTLTKKNSQPNVSSSKRKSIKNNISAPVALISTTNILSYTSPSLRVSQSRSSLSSSNSPSPTNTGFPTSPLSGSSGDDTDMDSPRFPNPLSAVFQRPAAMPVPVRSHSTRLPNPTQSSHQRRPSAPSYPAPMPSIPRAQPPKALHSTEQLSIGSAQPHPFGAELAQVQEMAEEIGITVRDAEVEFMEQRGLQRFRASDYTQEIWEGTGDVFEDRLPISAGWI